MTTKYARKPAGAPSATGGQFVARTREEATFTAPLYTELITHLEGILDTLQKSKKETREEAIRTLLGIIESAYPNLYGWHQKQEALSQVEYLKAQLHICESNR